MPVTRPQKNSSLSGAALPTSVGNPRLLKLIEILALGYWFYSLVLPVYGITPSGIGSLWLVGLTGLVLLYIHPIDAIKTPSVLFPLLISLVAVGIVWGIHGDRNTPLGNETATTLFPWVCTALLASQLVNMPGFMKRFLIFMFIVAVFLLPQAGNGSENRLGIDASSLLGNPNSLGAWTGFTAFGLIMWAYRTGQTWRKALLWGMSGVMLVMLGLTTSRGALLSFGVSGGLFFLYVLRTANKPRLIASMIVLGIGFFLFAQTSVYQVILEQYNARLLNDTGRDSLWEGSVEIIKENPVFGIGAEAELIETYGRRESSHNPFLALMTRAGVLPGLLLAGFYVYAFLQMRSHGVVDGCFWIPALLVYQFMEINTTNWFFVMVWAVVVMAYAMSPRDRNHAAIPA